MNAGAARYGRRRLPIDQVEEPPHHMRAQQPETTDADLEFLTEFNAITGRTPRLGAYLLGIEPAARALKSRAERALPHLLQLNCDVLTIECASSDGQDLHLFKHINTDKKIGIAAQTIATRWSNRSARRGVDQSARIHPQGHIINRLRFRPRRPVAADRVLQMRGAGQNQYRLPRTRPPERGCADPKLWFAGRESRAISVNG